MGYLPCKPTDRTGPYNPRGLWLNYTFFTKINIKTAVFIFTFAVHFIFYSIVSENLDRREIKN